MRLIEGVGHLNCQFQSALHICSGAYIVNEQTRSPHKFHVSLKQLISFETPWHILQSAEKPEGLQEICSSVCWTEFHRYLLLLCMCLKEGHVGCCDGVKVKCLIGWATEYSKEYYWLLWKIEGVGGRLTQLLQLLGFTGWCGDSCPCICGLMAVEQAH